MANVDRNKPIVFEGQFVRMANELSLYNLLGYNDDPKLRVTPATLDIYRRLRQYRNNDETSPMYGRAWPNQKRLAIDCVVNVKTIRKHLDTLEAVGLIQVKKTRRSGHNKHEYTFPEPLTEAQFRAKYPECIERYFSALEALADEEEEDDSGGLDAA